MTLKNRRKLSNFMAKLREIEKWRATVLDTVVSAKNARTPEMRDKLLERAIELLSE